MVVVVGVGRHKLNIVVKAQMNFGVRSRSTRSHDCGLGTDYNEIS